MSQAGGKTGRRNSKLIHRLETWAEKDNRGVTFDSSTGFILPNGAKRSPDASWVRRERWESLTEEQQDAFVPLCPDFVVELLSPKDRLSALQRKMAEYVDNGAHLGWLLDPKAKRVYVHRPRQPVECLESPTTLSGDPVLPGFVFHVSELW